MTSNVSVADLAAAMIADLQENAKSARVFRSAGISYLSGLGLTELDRLMTVAGFEHGQVTLLSEESGLGRIKAFDVVERFTRMAAPALLLEQLVIRRRTLLMRHLQNKSPLARSLYQALVGEGLRIIDVAAVLSAPHTRGTVPHADGHPILVMQVHGRKHWRYWDVVEDPLINQVASVSALSEVFEAHAERGAATDVTLDAGDILFLPRRAMHTANTGQTFSLSLNLQLSPQDGFDEQDVSLPLVDVLSAFARP